MSDRPTDKECPTCTTTGRHGYCALGRCYCGHSDCAAFESWTPLPDVAAASVATQAKPRATAWDTREESTWIDSL